MEASQRQFCEILAALRRDKGVSQRHAASDLHISQALLSHYENGAREPGLAFVCRACDYYGVTADYLLGRTGTPDARALGPEVLLHFTQELRQLADKAEALVQ